MVYHPDIDLLRVWYSVARTVKGDINYQIGYTERKYSKFLDALTVIKK